MKILTVTDKVERSGAGIAAARLHHSLCQHGTQSTLAIARGSAGTTDAELLQGRSGRILHTMRRATLRSVLHLCGAPSGEPLSANILPTRLHRRINASGADIAHLHWIGLEMITLTELTRINPPVVWTLHDEWFGLGLEHYAGEAPAVAASGYPPQPERSAVLRWLDANVRARKRVAWPKLRPRVVCPSHWLERRMRDVAHAAGGEISVIPNPVPTAVFTPTARDAAKAALGLPEGRPVVGAGALNAVGDPRKGYAQLRATLQLVKERAAPIEPVLLMFGASSEPEDAPLKSHLLGTIDDEQALALAYSAMDVFVCPSLQENYPNTIAEALSCGTPCVAFRVGGIPEMIEPGLTGYLANPFDVGELCDGVLRCLVKASSLAMALAARDFALRTFAPDVVASRYRDVYCQVLAHGPHRPT